MGPNLRVGPAVDPLHDVAPSSGGTVASVKVVYARSGLGVGVALLVPDPPRGGARVECVLFDEFELRVMARTRAPGSGVTEAQLAPFEATAERGPGGHVTGSAASALTDAVVLLQLRVELVGGQRVLMPGAPSTAWRASPGGNKTHGDPDNAEKAEDDGPVRRDEFHEPDDATTRIDWLMAGAPI